MKSVVLIGQFPPPVHGMAVVNRFVEQALRERDGRVAAIDVSPGVLVATGVSVATKALRVALGLCRLVSLAGRRQAGAVYIGLSGGKGQVYELLFILVAKAFRVRLFLHHHSFAYIDSRSALTELVIALAGRYATHVVLCERMRSGIEKTSRRQLAAIVLSNFAFAREPRPVRLRARVSCCAIGYLSNISPEKGIMLFLDMASRIKAAGLNLKILVAGPFEDRSVERAVTAKLGEIGGIDYRGAVYGLDKQSFFDEIDLMVFPSQYVHEAEPVTVIEALTQGIPVVATERGCLSTLVPFDCGLVVPRGADFVESAVQQLQIWVQRPDEYRMAAQKAARWAETSHGLARDSLADLCSKISRACSAAQ